MGAEERISVAEYEAFVEIHWITPLAAQAAAIPFSPLGCTILASAAGATNNGSELLTPCIRHEVSTLRTFLKTRGRNQIRSKKDLFAFIVIRSVAAEE